MLSPFPGMDPYIEQAQIWVDFHNRLADEISAHLNAQIRPNYFARLTPYTVYDVVEVAQTRIQGIRPDVDVLQRSPKPQPMAGVTLIEAVIDPPTSKNTTILEMPIEWLSVEIRRTGTETLITVIEILSPVNKQPWHDAYADYQRKRREILHSTAHLMEIDLLRGGVRPASDHPTHATPYYITLSRVEERPSIAIWAIPLNSRLPVLPVPLAQPDPDVPLHLGQIMANVYERGGYDVQIDYHQPVPPPVLTQEEAAWVDERLARYR